MLFHFIFILKHKNNNDNGHINLTLGFWTIININYFKFPDKNIKMYLNCEKYVVQHCIYKKGGRCQIT